MGLQVNKDPLQPVISDIAKVVATEVQVIVDNDEDGVDVNMELAVDRLKHAHKLIIEDCDILFTKDGQMLVAPKGRLAKLQAHKNEAKKESVKKIIELDKPKIIT